MNFTYQANIVERHQADTDSYLLEKVVDMVAAQQGLRWGRRSLQQG